VNGNNPMQAPIGYSVPTYGGNPSFQNEAQLPSFFEKLNLGNAYN
jgi:hypothetical protein